SEFSMRFQPGFGALIALGSRCWLRLNVRMTIRQLSSCRLYQSKRNWQHQNGPSRCKGEKRREKREERREEKRREEKRRAKRTEARGKGRSRARQESRKDQVRSTIRR